MNRIYIAGPCSGIPELNYPAFNAEAARLRALGYHVENPADNPKPDVPESDLWSAYMRLAIAQLITCDTIALLPNWSRSRGATIEHQLANDLNLRVVSVREVLA